MCHAHQKMSDYFMLHWKEPRAFGFCIKVSVCELLWGEYLIRWHISARMLIPGTAMSPINPTFSQSNFKVTTDVGLATAPTLRPRGERSITMKKNYLRNTTPTPPGGLAPPKHDRQELRQHRRQGCKIRQKGESDMPKVATALKNWLYQFDFMLHGFFPDPVVRAAYESH